ncbi:MAG: SEC-C metal-binding domain-containing protein [Gemmatimonadetes bacterium]|nr:SEC-C metal-binding domain-containing protein [Gemmatimonadota bacterium]MDE2737451.1 SEC-C metal-binding domain-containing protein [Gemmatimonadota bacterium]
MQELATRLEALCQAKGAEKFSAEEIVELLTDGEEVDWIVDQVLPTAAEADRSEMGQVLAEIAAEVAPAAPPDTDDEEPAALEELDLAQLQQALPPGVDVQQVEEMLRSPQGAMLADFSAFCQERGFDGEPDEAEMRELHEEWLQTPRPALEGEKPADALDGGRLFPGKVETFRRETPKVGRNDPCPCGSGKKFKRCCGKAA